jgi:peptidyl-prolyl cis-trans isomerase B (cyclophilin B)
MPKSRRLTRAFGLAIMVALAVAGTGAALRAQAPRPAPAAKPGIPSPGAGPVIVMETSKGTIEFETYPQDAPKTVERLLALVKRNFYNGLRFHRVVPGFVIQIGDPATRDMTKRDRWGQGGSGTAIGVAEFSKKRTHVKGAVAMAHAGDATQADSQFYITLAPAARLDGKFTVFGQVISGGDVAAKIVEADVLKKMYVRAAPPGAK